MQMEVFEKPKKQLDGCREPAMVFSDVVNTAKQNTAEMIAG